MAFEAKARRACNGGRRYGEVVTLAEMYTSCVKQPIHQLTWAISAALNLYCKGYDGGNAFAEAPAPVNLFVMYPDNNPLSSVFKKASSNIICTKLEHECCKIRTSST